MSEIIQEGNAVLRKIAEAIPLKDISEKRIQNVINDMKSHLASQDDGVAIAAPQIGHSLRIFVVSGKVFDMEKDEFDEKTRVAKAKDQVYINPKITKLSRKQSEMEEGCLSVRWLYGQVKRSEKASIEAYDENGNKFKRGASGLLAQIFQHETDHLDGILFIDKADNVVDLPPKKSND